VARDRRSQTVNVTFRSPSAGKSAATKRKSLSPGGSGAGQSDHGSNQGGELRTGGDVVREPVGESLRATEGAAPVTPAARLSRPAASITTSALAGGGGYERARHARLDARAAANHKAEPSEATTVGAARPLTSLGEM
jgi:hypothetical protein